MFNALMLIVVIVSAYWLWDYNKKFGLSNLFRKDEDVDT